MCSQCFLSRPSNLTVIYDGYARNYYIVPPQLAYDICNELDLSLLDNADVIRLNGGYSAASVGGVNKISIAPNTGHSPGSGAGGADCNSFTSTTIKSTASGAPSGETVLSNASSRTILPPTDGVSTHANVRFARKRHWSSMMAPLPVDML